MESPTTHVAVTVNGTPPPNAFTTPATGTAAMAETTKSGFKAAAPARNQLRGAYRSSECMEQRVSSSAQQLGREQKFL